MERCGSVVCKRRDQRRQPGLVPHVRMPLSILPRAQRELPAAQDMKPANASDSGKGVAPGEGVRLLLTHLFVFLSGEIKTFPDGSESSQAGESPRQAAVANYGNQGCNIAQLPAK